MTTFHIEQFGCRATQADAAAIERQLLELGFAPLARAATADVVVINTCTVTASADSQARHAIRHFHAENPQARIIVTGCYAQRAPEELAQIDGVSWVVGNSHKTEIARLVECGSSLSPSSAGACSGPDPHFGFLPIGALAGDEPLSLDCGPAKILTGNIFEQSDILVAPVFGGEGDHTRPILKIQDGCSNRCSYCVIPFVRGKSRSLPPMQVIAEIEKLAAAGFQEIVLSGINLGSYGRDLVPRISLLDLVRRILDGTPLARLRLSSIEPQDVTQDLVELVVRNDRLARHFHIPLQSASDRILAKMHRWYRAAHYARKVELIRDLIPAAAIGADVIAGFPGETDADHGATVDFVASLPFSYLHVFSFSKRPGTAAEELCTAGLQAGTPLEVPPLVIKQRSRELRALGEKKKSAFRAAQVGSMLRVLTLGRQGHGPADCSPGLQTRGFSKHAADIPAAEEAGYNAQYSGAWTAAISDNYLQLRVPGHHPRNRFLDVRVGANHNEILSPACGLAAD